MTIGDRIKTARKQCGLTQTELAEAIGTSKQNICKYETGLVTAIPFDKFIRLAKALRVSTDYIAGFEQQGGTTMNEQNTPITPERIRDELGQYIIDRMYDGDEAKDGRDAEKSYSDMAAAYRKYLERTGVLTKVDDLEEDIPLYLETLGAIQSTKTIFGVPVETIVL